MGRAAEAHRPPHPIALTVPSGRDMRIDYGDDGSVSVSVKLQELFGLADTPRIGPAKTPITFHLLAPNGRPVQTTQDLKSFWERTYPEVRKELRGRYPRHPWPEDPWTAPPTHRTKNAVASKDPPLQSSARRSCQRKWPPVAPRTCTFT